MYRAHLSRYIMMACIYVYYIFGYTYVYVNFYFRSGHCIIIIIIIYYSPPNEKRAIIRDTRRSCMYNTLSLVEIKYARGDDIAVTKSRPRVRSMCVRARTQLYSVADKI